MVITCVAGQRAKDLKCVPEGAPVKVDIGKEGGEQRGEVRSLLEPLVQRLLEHLTLFGRNNVSGISFEFF